MKILHSSDWHLGKRLDMVSRMEEQKEVMAEICVVADQEDVDLVILAGDMFDNFNPSTEALNLYYLTLKKLSNNGNRPVVIIAGNHDSADLIEASDPLARALGIISAGYPDSQPAPFLLDTGVELLRSDKGFIELKLPAYNYPVRILLTPYANEKRLKKFLGIENDEQELRNVLEQQWNQLSSKYCDENGVNLLTAHLFFAKEGDESRVEPDDEKPILHIGGAQAIYTHLIPDNIQYTALGHLHRKQNISGAKGPVVYCSSPLSYSFSEANQDKYIMIVNVEPGEEAKLSSIKLSSGKKLLRKRFEDIDLAVKWLIENPDTLLELTIVADFYLSEKDRKRLFEVHDGIVFIIPEIKNSDFGSNSTAASINLEQNMEQLFSQYFEFKKGQKPNEELLALFKEILAVD